MRRTTAVMVVAAAVIWAVASVEVCRGWDSGDNLVENAKAKAEDMKQSAKEFMHDAKEEQESWTEWAYDVVSDGLGLKQGTSREGAENMMDNAEDAALRATDALNSATNRMSRYAAMKAGEIGEMAYGKAADIRDYTSRQVNEGIEMVTDRADKAKEATWEAKQHGQDKASSVWDEATNYGKTRLSDAYDIVEEKSGDVKDAMSGAYHKASDVAADKANDARGYMGEAMEHGHEAAYDAYGEAKYKVNKASDMAWENAEKAKDALSGAYHKASDVASDRTNDAREYMGEAKEYGRQAVYDAYGKAKNKVNEAWEGSQKANKVKEHATDGFNEAVNRVGEAYDAAKETMSESAKSRYEAAKERVSQATGDLGNKMRNPGEL